MPAALFFVRGGCYYGRHRICYSQLTISRKRPVITRRGMRRTTTTCAREHSDSRDLQGPDQGCPFASDQSPRNADRFTRIRASRCYFQRESPPIEAILAFRFRRDNPRCTAQINLHQLFQFAGRSTANCSTRNLCGIRAGRSKSMLPNTKITRIC